MFLVAYALLTLSFLIDRWFLLYCSFCHMKALDSKNRLTAMTKTKCSYDKENDDNDDNDNNNDNNNNKY